MFSIPKKDLCQARVTSTSLFRFFMAVIRVVFFNGIGETFTLGYPTYEEEDCISVLASSRRFPGEAPEHTTRFGIQVLIFIHTVYTNLNSFTQI